MTWWQAIIVAGSIALGVIAGIIIVRILFKKQLKSNRGVITGTMTNSRVQRDEDPLKRLLTEHKNANVGQKAQHDTLKNTSVTPEKGLPPIREPQPVRSSPANPLKEKPPYVPQEVPIKKTVEPLVDKILAKSTTGIVAEIEGNLRIAAAHRVDKPVSFQTKMWDANHDEMNGIPAKVITELGEVYINMRLANNLAWSITEFGDSTQELSNRYSELCTGIAARLTSILNKI